MNEQERAQAARIIIQQLGGQRFVGMTGAKNFVYGTGNGRDEVCDLTFKVMRNEHKTTHVRIALKGDDTYRMYFLHWNAKKMVFRVGLSIDEVYVENLRRDFKVGTGLYTSLAA